jgi:hypothetical protein
LAWNFLFSLLKQTKEDLTTTKSKTLLTTFQNFSFSNRIEKFQFLRGVGLLRLTMFSFGGGGCCGVGLTEEVDCPVN